MSVKNNKRLFLRIQANTLSYKNGIMRGIFSLLKEKLLICARKDLNNLQRSISKARQFNHWIQLKGYRHKELIAIAASTALHVIFVLFLLIHNPASLAAGGNNGRGNAAVNGMAVTLVDGEAMARMTLTTKAPSQGTLESTITPLQMDTAKTAPLALADSRALPQLIQESEAHATSNDAETQDSGRASSQGDGGEGAADDDLWDAIAPCWNRLADKNTLSITLEVSFDSDGNIASPPVFDADAADQSNPQLGRSETIAMQALAQCGGYDIAQNRQDVKINFPQP